MSYHPPHSLMLFLTALTVSLPLGAEEYRAAILDETTLPIEGCATPPAVFERVFAEQGVSTTRLNAEQLGDAQRFDAAQFDVLVVPTGASFPVMAKDSLLAFLQAGGDLLCSGGYAFDRLWERKDGTWAPCHEAWLQIRERARDPEFSLTANGGFEQGLEGWSATDASSCSVVHEGAFSGQACGRVSNPLSSSGGAWLKDLPVQTGQRYLIGARMKSDGVQGSGFAYMAVYQYDAQGALIQFIDFAQHFQGSDWKRHETEVVVAAQAARVSFHAGFYQASGTAWFDDLTCAALPAKPAINAHFGRPEDSLVIEPLQLPIFSPDQPIRGASLVAAPSGVLEPAWQSAGEAAGCEATAQLGQSARWMPLIDVQDAQGRFAGTAGAIVRHYAGPFTGSTWALFGVNNRDVFDGASGAALLQAALKQLRAETFLPSVNTDFAIYHPGEPLNITLLLRNDSRVARALSLSVQAVPTTRDEASPPLLEETRPVTLAEHSTQEVRMTWTAPHGPDFLRLDAVLHEGELMLDRAASGFCVYDDAVLARGTRLRYRDNAYVLEPFGGRASRSCLFGTDTYANLFFSPSQNPWTWHRELEAMRDHGLHLFENLQYTPKQYQFNEAQWRQIDALIQMSQRFGLPYMAGLLIGQNVAVSDAELVQQAELCRQFALRYKRVPGLIYYLNGDFQLRLEDLPDLRRLWNAFLKDRYANDTALQHAWGATPPEAALGELPVKDALSSGWYDVRARDMSEFKTVLMRRWIHALCAAIRQVDTEHPVTAEYYQRPINGMELRLSIDDMDSANIGYFDAPRNDTARLMATIKRNDLRYAGKSINIGEFGVKTHDAWSPERGGTGYHVQRSETEAEHLFWWVAHSAFALGVTKIQNWCWSDDPDRVFPWGLAWNNPLRPKPLLKLYRNLRLVSDLIEPDYRPAPVLLVLPDNWRLGASEALSHAVVMNAVECLLATNVPFDVANESQLPSLGGNPPRLVVMPCAYALSEASLAALGRVSEAGSHLYLSGDPSMDALGQRQSARLETLLGVRFEREITHASGLPVPEVTPLGAQSLENPCGLRLYREHRGAGSITWSPEPWESFAGHDLFVHEPQLSVDPAHNYYLSLLPACGISPTLRLEAERGVWRMTDTPSGANRLICLFPRSDVPASTHVRITGDGVKLELITNLAVPAMLLLNPQGEALLATGSGGWSLNGDPLASGEGAWTVASLDGQPLHRSHRLALSSTAGGPLWWQSESPATHASLCTWRDGKFEEVSPAVLRRANAGCALDLSPNELFLCE